MPGILDKLFGKKLPKTKEPRKGFLTRLLSGFEKKSKPDITRGELIDAKTGKVVATDVTAETIDEWLYGGYWLKVASSNVDQIKYDHDDEVLTVQFLNGSIYQYAEVPPRVAYAMSVTDSPGRFVWNFLRDIYNYRRVQKATKRTDRYPRTAKSNRLLNELLTPAEREERGKGRNFPAPPRP